MTFVASRGAAKELVLRATHARFDTKEERVYLEEVHVTVEHGRTAGHFEIRCDEGELDIATNDFEARGNVRGRTEGNREFTAPWVSYDHEAGMLFTNAPVMIYEDAAGFVVQHQVMPRNAQDQDVVVGQTRRLQDRLNGQIEEASFDRGFHSPENQEQLAEIIKHPCLPKPGTKQSVEQETTATIQFHQSRRRHSGIESAIGAMQSGNGLDRCRDRAELGFERYVALGILGRNLHTLGKMLIAQEDEFANAAYSKRAAA